jgi:hypothetical protein
MEIEGYPNYLIYEDGRVYSKKRNKFLKPSKDKKGYISCHLYINSNGKWFFIHRLIALHYIPNPENKAEVDHINDNPSDNRKENLQWLTKKENLDKRKTISNTGEKYIYIVNNLYNIFKRNWFRESLPCSKYNLEDAIMLRDALLSMEDDVV